MTTSRRLILSSTLAGFLLLLAVFLIVPSRAQQQPNAEQLAELHQRAEADEPEALFLLGSLYETGQAGRADPAKAAQYYRRAADLGLPHAQFNLGNMYASGHGLPADPFESVLWLRRAADAGLPEAQFNLAVAYEQGHGVRADLGTAHRWYERAAAQNYPEALYNLAMMYEDGHGVAQNDSRAAELYLNAARQGYGPAQNNYGIMLAEGRGSSPANLVDAYVWLSLSSEQSGRTQGRDLVAQHLSNEQRAAATRRLAEIKSELTGEPEPTPSLAPSELPAVQVAALNDAAPAAVAQVAAAPAAKPPIPEPRSSGVRPKSAAPVAKVPSPGSPAARVAADRQAQQSTAPAAPEPTSSGLRSRSSVPTPVVSTSAVPTTAARPISGTVPAVVSSGGANATAATSAKIKELEAANAALNDEVKRSTIQLSTLYRELTVAKDALAKAQGSAKGAGATGAHQEAGSASLAELRQKFDELSATNAKLADENRSLSQKLTQAGNSPSSLSTGALQTSQPTAALARLEAENKSLRSDLEGATRTLATLQRQLKNASSSPKSAPSGGSRADNANAIAAAVEREAAKYNRRIEELLSDSRRLADENRSLSQKLQSATVALQSAPASYEVERLQEDNAALNEELKRAKHAASLAREQAETRVSSVSGETARLNRRIEELSANEQKLAAQNRDLADQVQSAKLALASTVPAAELRSLENEKGVLRAEIDRLKSERSQAQSLVATASDDKNRLSREVAELRSSNQRLNSQIEELRQKSQSDAMRLASAVPASDLQQLQSKNTALSDQLARTSGELDALRRQLREAGASAETKLQLAVAAAVDAASSKHRRELDELQSINARLVAENRDLSAKSQTSSRALATSVPAEQLRLLEAEKTRLANELRRAENERDQIQARSSSAMLAQAENRRQIEELTAANAQFASQTRDLEARLAAAQQNATDEAASAVQLQALEREKSALIAEVSRLRNAESKLASTSTQTAELNRRLQDLTANSERLTAQNRDLEAQLTLAKQAVEAGTASAADLRRLENEKATLTAELARAKQSLAASTEAAAQLRRVETENAALLAELGRLKNADTQHETQLATAASQSAELNRRVQELSANSERLAARNRELETQLNMAKQSVALTVPIADFKRLEAQHQTLTAQLASSQQTIDGLQNALAKAESTQANTVRELQARIASAVEAQTAKAQAEVGELLAATQQLTAQNRDLAAQVQTLRSSLAGSVPADRLKELEAEKALAQAELDRAKNESALQLQIAQEKANKAGSELAALSRQVEQLSGERQQLVSDNLALSNQIQLAQLNLAASVPADELKRVESEKSLVEMNLKRIQLEHEQAKARLAETANAVNDHRRQLDELRANSNRLLSENRDLVQRLKAQEVALAAAPLPETVKKLESEKALLASALERAKREHDLYRQLSEARAAAAQAANALASHHRDNNTGGDAQLAQMVETLREQNTALRQKNDRLSAMALEMANIRANAANSYATGNSTGAAGAPSEAELRRRILELEKQLLEERVTTTRYGN